MTTRSDLKDVRVIADEINALRRRRSDLLLAVTGTTQNLTGMPRSGQHNDSFAEYAAKVDELERAIGDKVLERERKMQRIDADVERLPAQQRTIIRLRYYERMSWQKIAYRTHYSINHCGKIERQAVRNLEEMQ